MFMGGDIWCYFYFISYCCFNYSYSYSYEVVCCCNVLAVRFWWCYIALFAYYRYLGFDAVVDMILVITYYFFSLVAA